MIESYHELVKINHNLILRYIPDYPYRILHIGGSGSEKVMWY